MLKLIEISFDNFRIQMNNRKLYLWGAGNRAYKMCEILKDIDIASIVDNNANKWETYLECDEKKIPIISFQQFIKEVKLDKEVMLLITTAFYTQDIIKQLNQEKDLEHIECYILNNLIDNYSIPKFSYTKGKPKIPKKIHYCWFGGGDIPENLRRCIESWKRYCEDYEILRWDESNYDITKNKYMREAYEEKKWGFVPDYARLDILYKEGGIYLDTDVELLKSLDVFLNDEMFCAFINSITVGIGAGIGAVKGNRLIKELRDCYKNISFRGEDGKLNMTPANWYIEEVLKNNGYEIENKYQKKNNMVIYPAGVFVSRDLSYQKQLVTSKTVAIHHGSGSWHSEDQRKSLCK